MILFCKFVVCLLLWNKFNQYHAEFFFIARVIGRYVIMDIGTTLQTICTYVNRWLHRFTKCFLKWNGEVWGLSIPTYCTSGKIFMFVPSSELIKRAGGVRRAGGGAVYIPQGPRHRCQRPHCRHREKNNTLGTDKTSLFTTWPLPTHLTCLYTGREITFHGI